MMRYRIISLIVLVTTALSGQPDTVVIGFGEYESLSVSTGNSTVGSGDNTSSLSSYLPNESNSSRFLSQASLGHDLQEIEDVTTLGVEQWLEQQFSVPPSTGLLSLTEAYRQYVLAETSDPGTTGRFWRYAWWQYHIVNNDLLRQKVALLLSELFVISQESSFGNNGHATAVYYDILLDNAFGNYRDLLERVTLNPAMGVYLTSMNNKKTNLSTNSFPDENYAREIMQLFSIGTTMLNMDGSEILDANGVAVPSYDNDIITELAKVFTGLTWWNRTLFGRNAYDLDSWLQDMVMWEEHHEPGEKVLLNGFVVPDRDPVDGMADIQDAIDNIFNHQNVPPFVARFFIQRMITANPSPNYIERVANVFADNGNGVRGDMKAMIKAILLDEEARSCDAVQDPYYGSLKEPFLRYFHINKAFHVSTASGNFRNDMRNVYDYTGQRPLNSPTVFNFFQQNYTPIGPIEDNDLVAPVFQITDSQNIAGYINALFRWLYKDDIADEYDIYGGEPDENYDDERSSLNFDDEILLADDGKLHILLDEINLVLAGGRISEYSLDIIKNMVMELPQDDDDDKAERVKIAIYLVMSSPEYLINR